MDRIGTGTLLLGLSLTFGACSMGRQASAPTANNRAPQATEQQPNKPMQQPQQEAKPGALNAGEASGSYTAKGETVPLRYAYASRGERFGTESIIVLVTDKPIAPEAVAEEIKSQPLLNDEKLRGLEYVISKDGGYWVRFHPSQYQESKSTKPEQFVVENNTVRGSDEDNGDLANGKYSRSVKFVSVIQ